MGKNNGLGRRAGPTWLIGTGAILLSMLVAPAVGVAQQSNSPASSASSQAQPAPSGPLATPDIVVRKDGSMLRGTIFDRNPKDVTIQLPNGHMRTIPMGEVTYAGPETEMSNHGAPTKGSERRGAGRSSTMTLELTADLPEATFFLRPGTVAGGYQALCTAPCAATIPAGRHRFAVAQGRNSAIEVEGTTTLTSDSLVAARYESRAGLRAAGWTILGVGLFAGLLVASSSASEKCEGGGSGSCSVTLSEKNLAVGLGLMAVGMGVGIPLASIGDKVAIAVTPLDSNAGTRERGSRSLLPEGVALKGRF